MCIYADASHTNSTYKCSADVLRSKHRRDIDERYRQKHGDQQPHCRDEVEEGRQYAEDGSEGDPAPVARTRVREERKTEREREREREYLHPNVEMQS